eukprot:TRINITY_DN48672_c0_g1_i1.p1 TRINITY_DN48672_c0_g1~~TRINITY_DN48672_c0_g1_i1.p1  ORF type:complete len:311 (+),score=37.75 TRINITY_DN48672_c0_g1_i1:67-999(+)
MKLLTNLGVFFWNVLLVLFMLPTSYLLAKIGSLFLRVMPSGGRCSSHCSGCLSRAVILLTCLVWRLTLALACWIRWRTDGVRQFRSELGSSGRPCILLANHVSFLDTILAVSLVPLAHVSRVRMMAADRILSMPILGTIAKAMGHIRTPPKELLDNAEYLKQVEESLRELDKHIVAGGIAAWYPEGRMNLVDPLKVQAFRAGGLAVAVRHDVEIWCIASVGNSICWPRTSALGGRPCKIRSRTFRLCESSHLFLRDAPSSPSGIAADADRAKALYLAQAAQKAVQEAVDELAAEVFDTHGVAENSQPLLS